MSTTNLDVEIDLEALKKANEEKHRLANEQLASLKKRLEDTQKFIQDAPEQIEQLKKKLKDAHKKVTELAKEFSFLDEEEEDKEYYAQEKKKVEDAQRDEQSIDEQLKVLNNKFEQAKLDEIKLTNEIKIQQQEVQKLKKIMDENNNSRKELSQSQQTKTFANKNDITKSNNKGIPEEKKKEAFKHFKSLCDTQPSKYRYNDEKKEVELSGKGGIISFTKNSASTNSIELDDIKRMASDLFNAYVKDENDLKTVKFNASGPKKLELETEIAKLKEEKLKEFQKTKLNKPESRLNVDEESTQRFARGFTRNQ